MSESDVVEPAAVAPEPEPEIDPQADLQRATATFDAAQKLVEETESARDQLEAEIEGMRVELERFEALPEMTMPQLLERENLARRRRRAEEQFDEKAGALQKAGEDRDVAEIVVHKAEIAQLEVEARAINTAWLVEIEETAMRWKAEFRGPLWKKLREIYSLEQSLAPDPQIIMVTPRGNLAATVSETMPIFSAAQQILENIATVDRAELAARQLEERPPRELYVFGVSKAPRYDPNTNAAATSPLEVDPEHTLAAALEAHRNPKRTEG